MAVLSDVLLRGEDTKAGRARAKEQQSRKKNSRCSRPNLLKVSLPSAAFTLRAQFFFLTRLLGYEFSADLTREAESKQCNII